MKNSWGYKKSKTYTKAKNNNILNSEAAVEKEAKEKPIKSEAGIKVIFSIRWKILFSYLVPIILIMVLGIISYQKAANTIVANYEKSMENIIEKTAEYYGLMMDTIAIDCNQTAVDNSLRTYYRGGYESEPLQERKNFQSIKKSILLNILSSDFVQGIYTIASYGSPCISYLEVGRLDYNAYMQTEEGKAMEGAGEKIVFGGYHKALDEMTGKSPEEYAFTVKRNITNQASKPIGMIILDVGLDVTRQPLINMEMEQGSVCALITPDGRQIANVTEGEIPSFLSLEVFQEFLSSENPSGSYYKEYEGNKNLYLFSTVPETDFTVCAMIPQEQITAKLKDIQMATVVIVVIAVIMSLISGGFIFAGINNPIKKISKVMKLASEGDLTVTVNMKGKDEFRKLGDHVKSMLINTKELLQKASRVSGRVKESVTYVTATSSQLLATTENINKAISNVNEGALFQNKEADNCLVKMGELSGNIEHVYQEAGTALDRAQKSKIAVEQGISTMDVLAGKASETSKITGEVIAKIEALALETEAISEIVQTIKAIASRTNLLSLNARIEAARVGSAGNGFAVVAEEVRKLSVESMNSVDRIGDIVGKIESETKNTVLVARESETIVESQEVAMSETVNAFKEISGSVENLSREIGEIAKNMEQMERNKDDVMEAIGAISKVSGETLASANQVKAAVDVQLDAVKELNESTEHLDSETQKLARSISKFKIT